VFLCAKLPASGAVLCLTPKRTRLPPIGQTRSRRVSELMTSTPMRSKGRYVAWRASWLSRARDLPNVISTPGMISLRQGYFRRDATIFPIDLPFLAPPHPCDPVLRARRFCAFLKPSQFPRHKVSPPDKASCSRSHQILRNLTGSPPRSSRCASPPFLLCSSSPLRYLGRPTRLPDLGPTFKASLAHSREALHPVYFQS